MMTPEELTVARRQLARLMQSGEIAKLSAEDQALMKRYPKHTLYAARLIDATPDVRPPLPGHIMHEAGEDFQRIQFRETGTTRQ